MIIPMKKLFSLFLLIFSFSFLSAQTETKTETMKVLTATANSLTIFSKSLEEKNNGVVEEPLKSELIKTIGAIQSTRTEVQSLSPAEIEKKKNKIAPLIKDLSSFNDNIANKGAQEKSATLVASLFTKVEKLYKEITGRKYK